MTQYLVAGTSAIYERDRDWEKVKIPGPIQEDILIYVNMHIFINHSYILTQFFLKKCSNEPYNEVLWVFLFHLNYMYTYRYSQKTFSYLEGR